MTMLKAEIEALSRFVPLPIRESLSKDPLRPPFRRQTRDLSVLFVDIAGCTAVCEWLCPERMQETLEEFFSSFVDEIYELGGVINETAGDGFMTLFLGDEPEEHACAAARAAALVHGRTREFKVCRGDECRDLDVHIGINSGTASLGVIQLRGRKIVRSTFSATGPVTNVAARLAALAPRGKIYVGEETWRRIKSVFDGSFVSRLKLKNVSHSVGVYEVNPQRADGVDLIGE